MDSENLKLVPYSTEELLKLTYVISTKFQRITMLVTTGYQGTEEKFAADEQDPYCATEFRSLSADELDSLRALALFKNLTILNKYAFDQPLSQSEEQHLYEGFGYIGGVGDFCLEALFPVVQYLALEIDGKGRDYFTQEPIDKERFRNFLIKFLTKLSLEVPVMELEDYGLFEFLKFDEQGYSFKQLAIMLGLETERTARGLASTNTPLSKRIRTFKANDGSNRTFIEKDEFANYVRQYHRVRSVQIEDASRRVYIKLTGGNIRNNHIYLTKVMDLFPAKYIGGGNKAALAPENLILDIGHGKMFETDIDGNKKIFRSRAALKAFYENYDVTEGDTVVITEVRSGQYSIRPE